MPCDDCSRTEACPPCPEEEECRCGPGEMCGACFESKVKPEDVSKLLKLVSEPEEPPLTPEEEEEAAARTYGDALATPPSEGTLKAIKERLEEQAPEDEEGRQLLQDPEFLESMEQLARGEKVSLDEPPPPQPERRPPYAVAYSVSGHLFEVALPGDATVRAVDGVLVIQHHLGPVAGIVQVLPVINKES